MLYQVIFLLQIIYASCDDFDNNCTSWKKQLATSVSNFTQCALLNARPITLCESCIDSYLDVLESYKNLTVINGSNGQPCISNYIDLDQLEIVKTLYNNAYTLWNRAKCYECFEIVNGSLTRNQSDETQIFNQLLNTTWSCINATKYNESVFCTKCVDDYLALNYYYISISNINEKIDVCMDLVDLMNGTRNMWSEKCCEYRRKSEYIFLGTTILAIVVTIIFYVLAKFCTDMKKTEIIQQSRFTGSLNNVDNINY